MPTRLLYLIGFFAIVCILALSMYLQLFDHFEPCPLCSLQRFTFALLGILFLLGFFLPAQRIGRCIINILLLLASILGLALAGRQIWLQHFPSVNNSECGVTLEYMLQVFPMQEVLQKIMTGSAECTQIGWQFLHLNMAEWAFIWFAGFFFLAGYLLFKKKR